VADLEIIVDPFATVPVEQQESHKDKQVTVAEKRDGGRIKRIHWNTD
jgi:hypothetical protein